MRLITFGLRELLEEARRIEQLLLSDCCRAPLRMVEDAVRCMRCWSRGIERRPIGFGQPDFGEEA